MYYVDAYTLMSVAPQAEWWRLGQISAKSRLKAAELVSGEISVKKDTISVDFP